MLTEMEWNALRLSLLVASVAVLVSLPVAILLAYRLARSSSRGMWIVETLVNLPLVLPPVVTGYLLLVAFGRSSPLGGFLERVFGFSIAFTWLGAAVAAAVVGFPLMVRAVRLAFEAVDPRLELAAQSLGANRIGSFLTVSLPLAKRGVIAGAVLAFARGVGEFGATIMIAGNIPGKTQTIPLAVYAMTERPNGIAESWRLVALSVLIAAAAIVVSRWVERRQRNRSHA
ncbi:MAG: molybdate ABC transporter permease [Candidatus Hydrogenedentota bacterium]